MYLKALEIQGFKSFPDKTVLTFNEDITAIVGPNGTGKSNIAEAICWVLGEQSAKNLRGSKMEDVIFSGTERRGGVGFAQVTLVLDNSRQIFPEIDAAEVMVTRRYYRSGESEYYINKQAVRLKDINELFMDTGMGREGYSSIGQGRIAEILSVKSTDRREIFEEAAGISRYRHRKEETERKLERTRENLVRIHDKISELELQVQPLRQQAETARRYLLLRDEMRLLEISLWLEKLEEIKAVAHKLQVDTAAAREEKAKAEQLLEQLYQENEGYAAAMQQNDLVQEECLGTINRLEGELGNRKSQASVLETNARHSSETILLLEAENTDRQSRSQSLLEQMEEHQSRILALEQQCGNTEQELQKLNEQLAEIEQQARILTDHAEEKRRQEQIALDKAAVLRTEYAAGEASIAQLELRCRDLQQEQNSSRVEELTRSLSQAMQALNEAEEETSATRNQIQGYTLRLNSRRERFERIGGELMKLTMEQNNLTSRIRMLSDMEKEYEGFHKAVRTVMQTAERGGLRGIHGPVANLMRTESRYTVALEIALGAGLQNLVVDREEDAKAAIQFLKQRDGGRATFLPLTAIQGGELRESGIEQMRGFVGVASRLVTFDDRYRNIFENLLGKTVVVEDMDSGIAMARQYQSRFRIVTLDGQVLNRGGSMTGGSVSQSSGILSRATELEQLQKRQAPNAEKLSQLEQEKATVHRELVAAQYELETAESQRRAAEDCALRCRGQVEHYEVLLRDARSSRENQLQEQQRLNGQTEELRQKLAELQCQISRQETEAANHRRQWEEQLSQREVLLEESRSTGEATTTGRAALAGLRAEQEALRRSIADLQQVCRDMESDRCSREQRLAAHHETIARTRQELDELSAQMDSLRQNIEAQQTALSHLRQDKLQLEQKRSTMSHHMKESNDRLLQAEREVTRLEQKLSNGEWEEQQILGKLWETYELSHSEAVEQRIVLESVSRANRRVGELKREIAGLGSVNIGAIEEFDRVNDRYTYLTGQRDDVEQARRELDGIMRDITKEMTVIFRQQFDLLNQSFQETFVELFGGGQAQLELEDEENILDCGIEIRVQPPGKSLRTLTLLSGGEMAFVAVALYFAILKVHPTPFCVMDEIEAALDESNVVRFARYMRRLARQTQFIVITHRRGTMEESDMLYGVTMQEKGVSRVLTMHLKEAAEQLAKSEQH